MKYRNFSLLFLAIAITIVLIVFLNKAGKNDNRGKYESMLQHYTKIKEIELNMNKKKVFSSESLNKTGEPSLIFFFTNRQCKVCIESCLLILDNMVKRSDDKDVTVISFFDNKNMYKYYQKTHPGLRIIEGRDIDFNKLNTINCQSPVFFEVDSSNVISNFFIPDKNIGKLTVKYLESYLRN